MGTTIDFTGLTEEQISELQDLLSSKLEAYLKENEKKNKFLSVEDSEEAFEVLMQNSKPAICRKEVWKSAIEWCKAQKNIKDAKALKDRNI